MSEVVEWKIKRIESEMIKLETNYPGTFQDLPEYQQYVIELANLDFILHDSKLQRGE